MSTLLIHQPDAEQTVTAQTVFGGRPSAAASSFVWPQCSSCEGNMQFLGQIRSSPEELLLLFMCQNEPGGCAEWDADEGANRVLAVSPDDLQLITPPEEGETVLALRYGAQLVEADLAHYDQARMAWAAEHAALPREVLGQLGGQPLWLQGDATPQCDACEQPMQFVAQLEQGPDPDVEMNFGGGCAYVFRCACQKGGAKMLWQC
ncbi:hypothetical protein V8J88_15375 [Massilia sp. W12]|uniref:hypothetical protein n=1 Tax=Massilia sp. W12 TaxID=3126507 RepID=UPI0030CC532E